MPPNHPPQKTGLLLRSDVPEMVGRSAASLELTKGVSLDNASKSVNFRRSIPSNVSHQQSIISPPGIGSRDPLASSSALLRNAKLENSPGRLQMVNNIATPYGGHTSYGNHGYNAYGGMGGLGMMGMGMGYPGLYGMGMGYSPLMGGPMAFLGNINYIILGVGQFITMLGMSSTMFVGIYQSLVNSYHHFETIIRQSTFRRWLQKKCKKSAVFRFIIVIATMAIIGTASKLVKDVLKSYLQQWGGKSALLAATTSIT